MEVEEWRSGEGEKEGATQATGNHGKGGGRMEGGEEQDP